MNEKGNLEGKHEGNCKLGGKLRVENKGEMRMGRNVGIVYRTEDATGT